MTGALQEQLTALRRQRVPTALVRSFTWYRALGPERRHALQTRLGNICGRGPCTPEAWVLARSEIQTMNEPPSPQELELIADVSQDEHVGRRRHKLDVRDEFEDALREFLRAHPGRMVRITIRVP